MRQTDGRISRVRIEESTREVSKVRAARVAADLYQFYHEQAYRPKAKASPSFTDAAITYVETKQPSKRDRGFVAKLVQFFGETPIADIDQAAISQAAHALYPEASASTHVRAVYAPACTVLRIAGVRPDWKRPKHRKRPITIPPDEWFARVLPACEPSLRALLLFLTLTGRRISEALEAIDNGDGTATIGKTKSGNAVVVAIPDLVQRLLVGVGVKPGRLFTYGDRHNVYRALLRACDKAGVLVRDDKGKIIEGWYGSHALGRHSFCTRLLREGYSTKFVADAAGHASTRMIDLHYGHLEQSEVQTEVRKVGQRWGKRLAKQQKMAQDE